MPQRKLKDQFCAWFGCPPQKYRERALKKCLHWHARLLAPVLRLLDARFFDRDLTLIHDIGNAQDWRGVEEALDHFRFRNSDRQLTWHADFRLMVSAEKVRALADLLLTPTEVESSVTPPPAVKPTVAKKLPVESPPVVKPPAAKKPGVQPPVAKQPPAKKPVVFTTVPTGELITAVALCVTCCMALVAICEKD